VNPGNRLQALKLLLVVAGAVVLAATLLSCGNFFAVQELPTNTPRFAYVADFNGGGAGSVIAFSISNSGALAPVGAVAAGVGTVAVSANGTGNFVYAANQDGTVSAYTVNRDTGALTPVSGTFTAGTSPSWVAVQPDTRFVYVANGGSNDLSGFSIIGPAGTLVPVPKTPFACSGSPVRVIVDPSGRFVYVAEGAAGAGVFFINGDGSLTSEQTVTPAAGASASAVTVEPRARFAYITDSVNSVSAFAIDSTSGKLTSIAGSATVTGTNPVALTTDGTGSFLYVANRGSNDIAAFRIDPNTGALTSLGANVAAASPLDLASDPSGRFLYVVNSSGVATFTISSGSLSPAGTVGAGRGPISIVVTP
jgi:DNA-binding beta-propeller fold protein YncE